MKPADGGGGMAEEGIRAYLDRLGYFAVRGVKLRFDDDEATDLDIWAYGPGSPTHRERVIVDAKYKLKGAHGFERLVWLERVRRMAGAEHAILATTDKRESLRTATTRAQMRLIGPDLFDFLIKENESSPRLSQEELFAEVIPQEDKLFGRVRERIEQAKSRLLKLDWDSANAHVHEIGRFVADTTTRHDAHAGVRGIYLVTSYFLITLDFLMRDASFLDTSRIFERIDDGLRFGTRGRQSVARMLETVGKKKRSEALRAFEEIPVDILAEYFGRYAGTPLYFDVARVLESAAFNREFVPTPELPAPAQATVGVLLDYLQVDRRVVFNVVQPRLLAATPSPPAT